MAAPPRGGRATWAPLQGVELLQGRGDAGPTPAARTGVWPRHSMSRPAAAGSEPLMSGTRRTMPSSFSHSLRGPRALRQQATASLRAGFEHCALPHAHRQVRDTARCHDTREHGIGQKNTGLAGECMMSGATASRTRHRHAADRQWLAQRCSREGCAVEHLHGVDGGLVAQHRRGRARGVHVREHQERRRLQPGHHESVCGSLKPLTTLLSTLMMPPSCKPGMRATYRPGWGGAGGTEALFASKGMGLTTLHLPHAGAALGSTVMGGRRMGSARASL